jgi:hypothetical protein
MTTRPEPRPAPLSPVMKAIMEMLPETFQVIETYDPSGRGVTTEVFSEDGRKVTKVSIKTIFALQTRGLIAFIDRQSNNERTISNYILA